MTPQQEIPFGFGSWRELFMSRRRKESAMWVRVALKNGLIPQATTCKCVDCGNTAQCYDHRDYRKPHIVQPVCKRCDCRRGTAKPSLNDFFTRKQLINLVLDVKPRYGKQRIEKIIQTALLRPLSCAMTPYKRYLIQAAARRKKIRAMVEKHGNMELVAKKLGITRERVRQIVDRP